MTDNKCNGWTNYETWRVNLEVFDGLDPFEYFSALDPNDIGGLAESLQQYAEEVIFDCPEVPEGLASAYARAFLQAVNWHEIAEIMIESYKPEDWEKCPKCGDWCDINGLVGENATDCPRCGAFVV